MKLGEERINVLFLVPVTRLRCIRACARCCSRARAIASPSDIPCRAAMVTWGLRRVVGCDDFWDVYHWSILQIQPEKKKIQTRTQRTLYCMECNTVEPRYFEGHENKFEIQ